MVLSHYGNGLGCFEAVSPQFHGDAFIVPSLPGWRILNLPLEGGNSVNET